MDNWCIIVVWTGNEPTAEYEYASRELMIEHWNGLLTSSVVAMVILMKNGQCLTSHNVN